LGLAAYFILVLMTIGGFLLIILVVGGIVVLIATGLKWVYDIFLEMTKRIETGGSTDTELTSWAEPKKPKEEFEYRAVGG
jgi:uncharacterized membrane protein